MKNIKKYYLCIFLFSICNGMASNLYWKDELLNKYILQSYSESALAATYAGLMAFSDEDMKMIYSTEKESVRSPVCIDEKQKKALLMALVRLNLHKDANLPFDYVCSEFDVKSLKNNDSIISGNITLYEGALIYVHSSFLDAENFLESLYGKNLLLMDVSGYYYSEEFLKILSQIADFLEDKLECDNANDSFFPKQLTSILNNNDASKLALQYDFLKKNQESHIIATYEKQPKCSVIIPSNKAHALLLGIFRLRLPVNEHGLLPSRLLNGDIERIKVSGHAEDIIKFSIENIGEFRISIMTGMNNVVYISTPQLGNVFPENGGYYSPELYNLMLSIYSDMVRCNIVNRD